MGHAHEENSRTIRCAILTVSDTRDYDTDKGGQLIKTLLKKDNIEVSDKYYCIVKDEVDAIQGQIREWLDTDVDAIITTGGTGIALRDVTIEAVHPFIKKEIEGFGELFRYLSYAEDVGTKAMLSRAIGGTVGEHGRQLLFSLPGSTGAVKLAVERLIKPELNHFVTEINK